MLDEHLGFEKEIRQFGPTVAVICAGVSESMVHPGPSAQRVIERWAPESWHGVSGLQPRAYYSDKTLRRIRQKVTSEIKVAVKGGVIWLSKGRSRMSPEDFGRNLDALLDLFASLDCPTIVVGLWRTDERLFPRTNAAFARAQREIERSVDQHSAARLLAVRDKLDYWGDFLDDRFHLNDRGHRRVADLVHTMIGRMSAPPGPWDGPDPSEPISGDDLRVAE
jgi:hypothetical protein